MSSDRLAEANKRLEALRKARGVSPSLADERKPRHAAQIERKRSERERAYRSGAFVPSARSARSPYSPRTPFTLPQQSAQQSENAPTVSPWLADLVAVVAPESIEPALSAENIPTQATSDAMSSSAEPVEPALSAENIPTQATSDAMSSSAEPVEPALSAENIPTQATSDAMSSSAEPVEPALSAEIDDIEISLAILLGMTKRRRIYAGRCWLILWQLVNRQRGRQQIDGIEAQTLFTSPDSPVRMFGDRQWRKIRNAGNGTFWDVLPDGRLFIYGQRKVADGLDVERHNSIFATIDPQDLRKKPNEVKADILAAFYKGRDGKPISRATITDVTGIKERTQRNYEENAGIETRKNIAILMQSHNEAETEELAWKLRHKIFRFTDYQGKQGRAGETYIARTLPNSYHSTAKIETSRNKAKRLNKAMNKHSIQGRMSMYQRYDRLYFVDDAKGLSKAMSDGGDTTVNMSTPTGISCGVYNQLR